MPKLLAISTAAFLALIPVVQAQAPPTGAVSVASDQDTTWVLTRAGGIDLLQSSSKSSLPVHVTDPVDMALSATGNLVVAHNGPGGAQLSLFDGTGKALRTIEAAPQSFAHRVAVAPTGETMFLTMSLDGLMLRPFDANWNAKEPFPVGGRCAANRIDWKLADLAVDGQGGIWVADIMACGAAYTIRKYDPDGTQLNTLVGKNQFSKSETNDSGGSNVAALIDIFVSDDRLFVVLGESAPGGMGIVLDVWTLAGEYVERVEVLGPDLLVQGSAADGWLKFVSLEEPGEVLSVSRASLTQGAER